MALLDEWQAPEPSPYFDTRMQARSARRNGAPTRRVGCPHGLHWLRRPAWAMSLAAVLFAGALRLVSNKSYFSRDRSHSQPILHRSSLPVQPGTAVGDLQALERNDELYADFDMLDDLQVQDDVTANP